MNFLGMGPGELMLVMVLALIVFGPGKLPEIGQGLGKAIREFRRATSQITEEFTREIQLDIPPQEPRRAASSPPPSVRAEEAPTTAAASEEPLMLEIKRPGGNGAVSSPSTEVSPAVQGPDGQSPAPRTPSAAVRAQRHRIERRVTEEPVAVEEPMSVEEPVAPPAKPRRRRKVAQPAETVEVDPSGDGG